MKHSSERVVCIVNGAVSDVTFVCFECSLAVFT